MIDTLNVKFNSQNQAFEEEDGVILQVVVIASKGYCLVRYDIEEEEFTVVAEDLK